MSNLYSKTVFDNLELPATGAIEIKEVDVAQHELPNLNRKQKRKAHAELKRAKRHFGRALNRLSKKARGNLGPAMKEDLELFAGAGELESAED